MNDSKPGVAERIREVRARFLSALPALHKELATLGGRLRHLGWDPVSAQQIQRIAHRLAGTGATFGFPEISRQATPVDSAIGKLALSIGVPQAAEVNQLCGQVDDLVRVLAGVMQAPQPEDPHPAASSVPSAASTEGALVVVIDDDEFLRARLAALLEGSGYRVAVFASPEAAMPLLREEHPGAVLLDLGFPGRQRLAFDTVAEIRAETGERTPVILISAHSDFVTRLEGARAGADTYLVKPLDDADLLANLGRLALQRVRDDWRVLVVDDDALLAQQVREWLESAGMTVQCVTLPSESWLRVREFHPDVVLLDVNMPECNGVELATMLRQDPDTVRLPIVFMTAGRDEVTRRAAVAAGADDYLLKPLEREALLHSVRSRARLARRTPEQLGRITREDERQGGWSRHFFFAELERMLDETGEGELQPALVLLSPLAAADAARQRGPIAAAALGKQLATRLRGAGVDGWSLLGDCMAGLLLPRDTVTAQRAALSSLARRLAAVPYEIDGGKLPGEVRAALLHLGRGREAAAPVALKQAEQMLSLALAGNAGDISEGYLGGGESGGEVVGHLPVSRLRLAFQPIATIDGTGMPVHAVLARLADREGNLLPAGKFLAQVEKRGWLPELDAWVFRQAHEMLTAQLQAESPMFLVVSVGTASLGNEIFMETVLATLAEHPMRGDHQCLILAVPESAAITHRGALSRINDALRPSGCALMLTGYGSSENAEVLLETFQPLFVRLDQKLVQRLSQGTAYSPRDRTLVDAALSANAGLVAVGIENARSLSALWSKGVRRFQGYFIQEPTASLEGPETG